MRVLATDGILLVRQTHRFKSHYTLACDQALLFLLVREGLESSLSETNSSPVPHGPGRKEGPHFRPVRTAEQFFPIAHCCCFSSVLLIDVNSSGVFPCNKFVLALSLQNTRSSALQSAIVELMRYSCYCIIGDLSLILIGSQSLSIGYGHTDDVMATITQCEEYPSSSAQHSFLVRNRARFVNLILPSSPDWSSHLPPLHFCWMQHSKGKNKLSKIFPFCPMQNSGVRKCVNSWILMCTKKSVFFLTVALSFHNSWCTSLYFDDYI